jgi:hypothetical protein
MECEVVVEVGRSLLWSVKLLQDQGLEMTMEN